MIKYDVDRTCLAIDLLVNPSFGDKRLEKLKEAVACRNPQKRVFFFGSIEPLNELVSISRQSMAVYAALVQLALDKRKLATPTEAQLKYKARAAENTATARKLERLATDILREECRLKKKKFTEELRVAYIKQKRKEWQVRRARFNETHANYKDRKAAYDACNEEIRSTLQSRLTQLKTQA